MIISSFSTNLNILGFQPVDTWFQQGIKRSSISDVHNLQLHDRIWLRIRDPNSSRRKTLRWFQTCCETFSKTILAGLCSSRCNDLRRYLQNRRICHTSCRTLQIMKTLNQSKLNWSPSSCITCLAALTQTALLWITWKFSPAIINFREITIG